MEQRPNPSSIMPAGDNSNNKVMNVPPDTFNFDLSDLIDDLLALVYADTAVGADVGGSLMLSTLPQRIKALRSQVQNAQDICRTQSTSNTPSGSTSAPAASNPGASIRDPRCDPLQHQQQLQLFLAACDLNPVAQNNLMMSLGTACVTKRQLLAELNDELTILSFQNDHFSI